MTCQFAPSVEVRTVPDFVSASTNRSTIQARRGDFSSRATFVHARSRLAGVGDGASEALAVGLGVVLGVGVVIASGDGVVAGDGAVTRPIDGAGAGGVTDGGRRIPEPAANAPPTTSRAAAAKSVMPRPRPNRPARREDALEGRVA